ncbi:universal stress protein [Bacillus sp. FJAT-45350]|uniref:universal stress protein n=1 Tax=Bacillus sp. FJAT-45350 TaxID=2011014 RepID=UPI000BB6CFD2|nr:universal stress protein [Bacillus sp. FJAT-45350]
MRILIATDDSKYVYKAFDFVKQHFLVSLPSLHFVHIIPESEDLMKIYPNIREHLVKQGSQIIEKSIKYFADYPIEKVGKVLEGEPKYEIINYAANEEIDLIVIGCRGLSDYNSYAMGSVSLGVMNLSKIPVMVIN